MTAQGSSSPHGTVSPAWLALREPADAAARTAELVDLIPLPASPGQPLIMHDLGCGTGSMTRWLAPRLPGPQHWILHDRDAELLAIAAARSPDRARDGSAVTVETRHGDLTRLSQKELAGASLLTASALLDMLTAEEVDRVVAACVAAGCPALLTLSVVGRVALTPPDPLDEAVAAAFNDHQRRHVDGQTLLGPDAAGAAVEGFTRLGADVVVRPSPWLLGAANSALAVEWFKGWVGAACEQRPALEARTRGYVRRLLTAASAGLLGVTVQHVDLLARPGGAPRQEGRMLMTSTPRISTSSTSTSWAPPHRTYQILDERISGPPRLSG